VHQGLLSLGLIAEVVLRERGALVGQLGFAADEDDSPLVSLLAELFGGFGAGGSSSATSSG